MRVPITYCAVCMLRDGTLIGRQAVTTDDGFLFESIVGRQDAFDISDIGRSIILEARLPGLISGAFLIGFGADYPWDLDRNGGVGVGSSDLLALLANRGPCP